MEWRARVGAVALSALALTSCTSPRPSPSALPSFSLPDLEGQPLGLFPAREAGLDALLPARLVLRNGCLYLVGETGASWLALWPWPGTSWMGNAVTVGDTTVPVGANAVFVDGESVLTEQDIDAHEWVKQPDAECLVQKVWWIHYVNRGT